MRTLVRVVSAALLLGVGLVAPAVAGAEPTGEIRYAGGESAVPDRYLVVLRDDAASVREDGAASVTRDLLARYGGVRKHAFENVFRGYSVVMPEAAAERLAANPAVSYVAQTHLVRQAQQSAEPQPNPPSWGLDRVDQVDLPLDKSFTYPNSGEGVHAYILSSGIRLTHQDIAGRTVDDPDFSGETDGTSNECPTNGHGSHEAGTIGGTQYGIAKRVTLHSVQTVGCGGSAPDDNLVKALDWLVANHQKPAVANMSLTADTHPYKPLQDAVKRAVAAGVTVAISAGNHGGDSCNYTPSDVTEAIIAGGSDIDDTIRDGTNTGRCIDLFAPAGNIVSLNSNSDTATSTRSGTSFASPHVVGAAALYLAANPSATPQQVEQGLVGLASTGKLTQIKDSPNKLLNVRNIGGDLDTQAPTVPGNPRSTGTTGTSVSLAWDASSDNVAVAGYDVYNGSTKAASVTGTTATVTGLSPDTEYTFTIRARDAANNVSADSAEVRARTEPGGGGDEEPPTTPGRPHSTGVTASSVSLAWDASVDDTGVTGYDVYRGSTLATTVTTTSATVSGLAAGTEYSFTIVAKDAAGNASKPTRAVVARTSGGGDTQAPTVPGNPRSTGATSTSISLAWDASSDNVGVAGYDVYNGSTMATSVTGTTATVTGLAPSTEYTFTIRARDAAGNTSGPSADVRAYTTGTSGRTFTNGTDFPIRDYQRTYSSIRVPLTGSAATTVTLSITVSHTCAEDLGISLFDPNGRAYPVKYSGSGNYPCTPWNGPRSFTVPQVSSPAGGTWQLRITDYGPGDIGTLESWSITL
ncbi:fibronectin type III domain-containing protein [Nocardioides speluncae]|uniref:fibronectin type III domain-containing protein n=1 Tax=Nocardioides speluncae TaxID=2670337 RepID=UPI000D6928FE|nr:S8 family serine peptidase [Nocardioides speluncae]